MAVDWESHYVARLQAMIQEGDVSHADDILLELLAFLGYDRVVEIYKKSVRPVQHVRRTLEH